MKVQSSNKSGTTFCAERSKGQSSPKSGTTFHFKRSKGQRSTRSGTTFHAKRSKGQRSTVSGTTFVFDLIVFLFSFRSVVESCFLLSLCCRLVC